MHFFNLNQSNKLFSRVKINQKIILYCFFTLLLSVAFSENIWASVSTSYEEKEVSYNNGNIKIAATLFTPKKEGLFPAVVIVHGSGKSSRKNQWTSIYAKALAKRGIAVLYPDKRGSGKSQGNWVTANFNDLAGDSIAGVDFIRNQPQIDKSQVGVIGFSQGGHIVPLAATRSPNIAFVASISASTVSMAEQIIDEVEMGSERAGFNAEQIKRISDINKKGIKAALTGEGQEEYLEALNKAKNSDLKGRGVIERFPTSPNHPIITFVKNVGRFDPMPYWKKTEVPILFVYGGKDTQVRVNKSIELIEENLRKADKNYTVLLFNKNGHGLYREDLFDFMARWILDKGIS